MAKSSVTLKFAAARPHLLKEKTDSSYTPSLLPHYESEQLISCPADLAMHAIVRVLGSFAFP